MAIEKLNKTYVNGQTKLNDQDFQENVDKIDEIIAYIDNLTKNIFPIGSVFITAINTNPQIFLGGTWILFGQGRALVGVDTSEEEFDEPLKEGGSKTVTLDIAHIPPHSHVIPNGYLDNQIDGGVRASGLGSYLSGMGTSTAITGSGQAHNNLQPYITVYFWRRIS